MSITVKEVLKMKEWKDCRLVAGEQGTDREVLYIDSMEVPDITPWLKKNELLITTGYAMNSSEDVLLDILRAMAQAQSAGIALKTKFFGEITEKIKDEADALKIPVIEVPKDMPFIDLANPLMKKIVDEQNQKLKFNKAMNEKFLAVQIEGGSFREIGEILGELLQCRVLVADSKQNMLCCFPEEQAEEQGWVTTGEFGEKIICEKLKNCQKQGSDDICYRAEGEDTICSLAIYVKNRCKGFLYAVGEQERFNELGAIALRQAAVYLALEFSKKGLMEQKEYYQDNNFFLDLISDNIQSEEDALRRARGLRWPPFPYCLAVADINGFEKVIRGKEEEEIQTIKDDIIQIHKDVVNRKRHCFFVGNKSDSFHCLFTKQADKEEITRCMEEIQEQVKRNFGVSITVGISTTMESYCGFSKAYEEARTAITIGKKKETEKICFIEELRMEEGFFEMSKMETFRNLAGNTLGILEEHDKKHGTCYMETLRVLTENLGARKETAETLYLHRNTLSYRIRQIEQLTGYNLNDPQTLFQVQIAVKIYTYMNL